MNEKHFAEVVDAMSWMEIPLETVDPPVKE